MQQVQEHLARARWGIEQAREAGPDSLLGVMLRRYGPKDDDPKAEAEVWIPPLPLLALPAGLSAANARRAHLTHWSGRLVRCGPFTPPRVENVFLRWSWLRLEEERQRGGRRREWRRRLMYAGLEAALVAGGELQRVCVGKDDPARGLHRWFVRDGTGAITPIVPADQHDLAYGGWLAQKAIGYAAVLLPVDDTEFDEVRPDKKSRAVAWPRDPETGREQEFAAGMWHDPDAPKNKLEELIEEEEREEGRRAASEALDARVYRGASPAVRRQRDALLTYMARTGADYSEARVVVADRLGIGPGALDAMCCRLRARCRRDDSE